MSCCKPNKVWVAQGSGFYNRPMKSKLNDNDLEMCSIHNEEKPVACESLIRTLKNTIYKQMTAVSKDLYLD